jgi:hypothetical protein
MPAPSSSMDVVVKVQPTSQVTGKVLHPDGTPVGAGVIVKYKSDEFKTFCVESSIGEMSCTTIPQGVQEAVRDRRHRHVPVCRVNAGTYTLTAFENADFSGRSARLRGSVRAGEKADVLVKLPGIADLIVNVFASDAQTLIPGARVQVSQIDYPNRSVVLFTGQTGDDRGVARFTGGDAFTEGPFVVTATGTQQNGFAGVASGKIVNDGETVTLNVYLATATGSVHGVVRRRWLACRERVGGDQQRRRRDRIQRYRQCGQLHAGPHSTGSVYHRCVRGCQRRPRRGEWSDHPGRTKYSCRHQGRRSRGCDRATR